MTGENKQKTKASMLQELESIKALLLEEDKIPLLTSDDDVPMLTEEDDVIPTLQAATEFIPTLNSDDDIPLLNDTLTYSSNPKSKLSQGDFFTPPHREPLAKGAGENPFLPQHIRARLHGNNPFPLFETETAQRIAQSSTANRLSSSNSAHLNIANSVPMTRQDLINQLIEKIMPELQHELHEKLDALSRDELEQLLK